VAEQGTSRYGGYDPPYTTLEGVVMLTTIERGCKAWDAGKPRVAFDIFKKAALSGEEEVFLNLGYCYDVGKGVSKNFKKAMFWYKKAVRSGDGSAAGNIGTMYRSIANFQRARHWFKKAIGLRNGGAALDLAKIYLHVRNKSNIGKARKYLKIAIKSKYISEYDKEEAVAILGTLKKAL